MNCLNWLSRRYRLLQTGTVIPLLIGCVTSVLHTFSNLSVASMIDFFKILIICLNWLSRWYRRAVNSYRPTYPGVKSILHTFSILSAPSMIEFFKIWKIALIDLVYDTGSYRRAANSYPPAYLLGFHGLRLISIGLWLGCPKSYYV